MAKKFLLKLLVVVATITLVAVGCGNDDDDAAPEPAPAPATEATEPADQLHEPMSPLEEEPMEEEPMEEEPTEEAPMDDEVVAAFVFVGPVGDAGWTWAHDQGRRYAENATGATTIFVESVPEVAEDFRAVVVDFIENETGPTSSSPPPSATWTRWRNWPANTRTWCSSTPAVTR